MATMNSQYVQQVKYADTKTVAATAGHIEAATQTVKQANVELNTLIASLIAMAERVFGPEDAAESDVESAPYLTGALPELEHNLAYQRRLIQIATVKAHRFASL